ncbi:MAG: PfkB family carbohydrate kinase [Planctomycetota bacterium]|jgi:sugar/nucleoside kinase (ribokinase family)
MSLLVVGSIAFDDIHTPGGVAENVLGGSSVYFACAASIFAPVRLVGVVGEDFPETRLDFLGERGVDCGGVSKVEGETFRWCGRYEGDMNEAETLEVHLNVFGDFQPDVPQVFRDSSYIFLANGAPATQLCVLDQVPHRRFCVADTMNLWIENERETLLEVIAKVDLLFINEGEVRMLTGKTHLVKAAEAVLTLGAGGVVVKKGEHGALFVSPDTRVALPGFPTTKVVDPTGAGDSFAGGFMGYVASCGDTGPAVLKKAMAYAMVSASFTVEDFSLRRLSAVDRPEVEKRYQEYAQMLRLD